MHGIPPPSHAVQQNHRLSTTGARCQASTNGAAFGDITGHFQMV
jgi:hypothetical protein